jgi:hypothetical protein
MDNINIPYFSVRAEVVRIVEAEAFTVRFQGLQLEIQSAIQEFVKDWYSKPPLVELEKD